jgi:hypothetical protein
VTHSSPVRARRTAGVYYPESLLQLPQPGGSPGSLPTATG